MENWQVMADESPDESLQVVNEPGLVECSHVGGIMVFDMLVLVWASDLELSREIRCVLAGKAKH